MIFKKLGEKAPFGKEPQALRPSSRPIQKAKSGTGGLEMRKSAARAAEFLIKSGARRFDNKNRG